MAGDYCLLFLTDFIRQKQNKIKLLHEDEKLMKNQILKYISIPSSIIDAKTIMEKNDFKCLYQQNSIFMDWELENDGEVIIEHLDYLYCKIKKGNLQWIVTIVHENNVVTKICVSRKYIFV